jgi:(1->4)-alpha-D-glucan 1-alpha-D-glucosylmutase
MAALIPRATYRVQLHAGFGFAEAEAIVGYLAQLGVSHFYASPILKARPGSLHGYDAIDPDTLNPEIGDEAAFASFGERLRQHGMALLLDIVPNHMGVHEADNAWWLDVLENGPAAEHANAFDIEWQPPQRELHGKVLLAVLGAPYGEVLEAGEIRPRFEPARGQFVLHYWNHRFPIDPADHAELLQLAALPGDANDGERAVVQSLVAGFARLPPRSTADAVERATRQREGAALKAALGRLHAEAPWAPAWLDGCAAALQGRVGEPASFDRLDTLLQRQAYRLAHWRAAGDELNYRRFFDIDSLAALRMEDPRVFEAAHRRILQWVGSGRVAGLRIDHPDGMADPGGYFQRLQRRCAETKGDGSETYVVIEKILADDEPWPREWPVAGETGYRFSNQVNGLFVDGRHAAAFDALYADFVGIAVDFEAELDAAKRGIVAIPLAADRRLITELAHDIAYAQRHTRDLTRDGLREAILELAVAFDVYRTYVSERGAGPLDRGRIEKCAAVARARIRPSYAPYVDFVRQLLLQPLADPALRACQWRFVRRLQQFTAPVMAKAMEDTAFYRYHRLVALNDVGGDPRRFGLGVAEFHAANQARLKDMPHTLLGSSTHDSKRSEDVRTRIDVLSEMPERWHETIRRWHELAQTQWRIGGLTLLPSANDALLLYQTLVGLWPVQPDEPADDAALGALGERVAAYMLKAVREAKQHSSWLEADDRYEQAVKRSVEVLLARLEPNPFLSDLRRFVAEIAPFGCVNSLALVALKLTAPGVPDVYQGCEDWKHALVDPDNRRPVDFGALQRRLRDALAMDAAALRRQPLPGGLHKLAVSARLLHARRDAASLFERGDYVPLAASGGAAAHVVAFARIAGAACSLTVVPRLAGELSGFDIASLLDARCWQDTAIAPPPGLEAVPLWHEVVTGRRVERLRLADVLRGLPVAVLRPAAG